MPLGTLEVLLVNAKGLENSDFLNKTDAYVVLTCRSQEFKSSVASGQGTTPEWNEQFVFSIAGDVWELRLKIFDSDTFTRDDFIGESTIPLEAVFLQGNIPLASYSVVGDEEFKGEIRVALTFIPEERKERGFDEEEEFGGWKQSSFHMG